MQAELRGRVEYAAAYAALQAFTASRTAQTPDQLWLCEHPPVFTQGLAGRPDHLLAPGDIPVVATNRGGQVTYHGPGQVVAYPMVDLQRAGYFIKEYVYRLEEAVIRTLAHYGVTGHRVAGAPGVYVRLDDPFGHSALGHSAPEHSALQQSVVIAGLTRNPWIPGQARDDSPDIFAGLGKIAALGVKVSRHCTYHGVALNVAMDLEPFERINPCGYAGLRTVDLSTMGVSATWNDAARVLGHNLETLLTP